MVSDGFECKESSVPFGAMIHSYSFNSRKSLRDFMEKEYQNSLEVSSVLDFNSAPKRFFNSGKR